MNIIEYNLVHQRTLPYSILAHEKIQEESIAMFQANDAFDFLLDEPDLYDDYVK